MASASERKAPCGRSGVHRLEWSDVIAWSNGSEHETQSSEHSSKATRPAQIAHQRAGGTTPFMFFVNITKAYLGGGVVMLPEAILWGGFVMGPLAILFLAFLLNHTMKLLIRMKEAVRELEVAEEEEHLLGEDAEDGSEDGCRALIVHKKTGLGCIGAFCFGWIGRVLVNSALLATNVGIVISYVNLNTQSFQRVIFGTSEGQKYQVVLWGQFVLVCFLCSLDPRQLSFSSLLGNAAVALTMAVVVVNSIQFIYSPARAPVQPESDVFVPIGDKVVAAIPNIFFSFVMHGTILSQHEALQPMERHRSPSQLNLAALIVSLAYAVYATIAYVAYFGLLTSPDYKVGTSILLVLVPQSGMLVSATTALLSLAILFSIPLFTDSVFDLLGLAWRTPTPVTSLGETERRGLSRTGNGLICLARMAVVLAMFGILSIMQEVAGGDDNRRLDPLSYPLKITGAVAMSWLGCIIPALFYLSFASRGVPTFKIASLDGVTVLAAGVVGILACIFGVTN